jgi:PAS domain S-box-containing protein
MLAAGRIAGGGLSAVLHALWLRGLRTSAPFRYGIAIGAALVASLIRIALNPFWGTNFPYIFYFPTTLFTALYGGAGPAWVGIAICTVITLVWVLPPVGILAVSDHVHLFGLATYVVSDGIIAWIGATHRGSIAAIDWQRRILSEREESLTRAEAAARQLAAIVESSDDAIIAKTIDGIITAWNSAATRMFGHTEPQAIGQRIDLIVPADKQSEEAELRQRVSSGAAVTNIDTVRLDKHGKRIDVSISVSAIRDAAGRVIGVSTIARDIRLRRHVEAERAALLAHAEAARAEAEDANRAKDDFLAILSHELRNPLATIVAGARILRQTDGTDEQAIRTREAIERQAEYLSRLVDDLLDTKRILSGDFTLELQPRDLAEVARTVTTTLREAGAFKDHTVSLDSESAWVSGDVVRLQQILTNLLGNAVKYTPAGGSIRVSVMQAGEQALIRVQDTGIGIKPDLLPRMFELFVQGDPGSTRVRSGLGIGLAVVRRLVELHEGTVEVWSDGVGKGSTFTVRLPASMTPSGSA